MQISGVNSFISQIQTLFQNKTTGTQSGYTPPSADITIDSILEKLSIDKKVDTKRQEIERSLTGFGKQTDAFIKKISEATAEIYKASLESELKNKVKELTQKEQLNKIALYQSANTVQSQNYTSGLNLYS